MNYSRAFQVAVSIWILGVLFFITGNLLPLGMDPELQANLTLAIAFLPLGWFGARHYYKKGAQTPAYQLALVMAGTAALLDALITVPVFFIPNGMGYLEFFGALGFWLLMVEYIAIVLLYDLIRRRKMLKPASQKN